MFIISKAAFHTPWVFIFTFTSICFTGGVTRRDHRNFYWLNGFHCGQLCYLFPRDQPFLPSIALNFDFFCTCGRTFMERCWCETVSVIWQIACNGVTVVYIPYVLCYLCTVGGTYLWNQCRRNGWHYPRFHEFLMACLIAYTKIGSCMGTFVSSLKYEVTKTPLFRGGMKKLGEVGMWSAVGTVTSATTGGFGGAIAKKYQLDLESKVSSFLFSPPPHYFILFLFSFASLSLPFAFAFAVSFL